jgi:hypothetical protein
LDAHDQLGIGVQRLTDSEPTVRASALARELGGVLCRTSEEADAELALRSALTRAGVDGFVSLERLARRLQRVARIAARTRSRAEAEVAERLAPTGTDVAVHPTTIRERAAAVDVARAAYAAAEVELERAGAQPAGAGPEARPAGVDEPLESPPPPPPPFAPPTGPRRNLAVGTLLAAAGLTLVLLGLRVTTLWAALLPTLVAALWGLRYLRPPSDADVADKAARREASSLLAEMGASTDELFGARRAGTERPGAMSLLTRGRDRALEDLRLAERAWQDVAGPEVDVAELEEVVRRLDPQHEDVRLLASEAVSVRATDGVLHNLERQWLAAWAELAALGGIDVDAPTVGEAVAAVAELQERLELPVVLVGPAVACADALASAAPGAPIIVVEPPGR